MFFEKKQNFIRSGAILPFLCLSACDDSPLDAMLGSHQAQVVIGHGAPAQAVVEVKKGRSGLILIEISGGRSDLSRQYSLQVKDERRFKLREGAGRESVNLDLDPAVGCYASEKRGDQPQRKVCLLRDGFRLEQSESSTQPSYQLTVQRPEGGGQPATAIPNAAPETPQAYSVGELFKRTMHSNFDVLVEYQHVLQAKLKSKNDHLNLFPHLSINSILSVSTTGFMGVVNSIGDLLPFILPNRWLLAKEDALKLRAENYANYILKADSANITESLAYALLRDEEVLQELKKNHNSVREIAVEMQQREDLGQFPEGSAANITSILNSIERDSAMLAETVKEEYIGLAMAAGFVNPYAIRRLSIDTGAEPVVEALDEVKSIEHVLSRSLELMQMDEVIHAMKVNGQERIWQWADPAGDPTGGLGLGYGAYIRIGQSQVNELKIRKVQMQAMLRQKAAIALAQLNASFENRAIAEKGVKIQSERVNILRKNMDIGKDLALADLVNALQDQIKSSTDLITAKYTTLIAASRISRLRFSGPYAQLGPKVP